MILVNDYFLNQQGQWMILHEFSWLFHHISYHVLERFQKSSLSFMEFFLRIMSLCHVRYVKLNSGRHWSQKYSFRDKSIIIPKVWINFPIKWLNGHFRVYNVTHHNYAKLNSYFGKWWHNLSRLWRIIFLWIMLMLSQCLLVKMENTRLWVIS